MARCVHEVMIPVYNPFYNPFSGGTTVNITELRWVCGCLESTYQGMECQGMERTDPKLKIRCSHYKPESVINQLPDRTENEHEPPPM